MNKTGKCKKCGRTDWNAAGNCRTCRNAKSKENARKIRSTTEGKDKDNAKGREFYRKQRQIVLAHYGGKCACCGETQYEFLTIDHVDGGGKAHRKEVGSHIDQWLLKNNFPPGFQVLCFNCNSAKGHGRVCPHQKESK